MVLVVVCSMIIHLIEKVDMLHCDEISVAIRPHCVDPGKSLLPYCIT